MNKRCPNPGCGTQLRMAPKTAQTGSSGRMLGTATNPVIFRCTKCRKNFEFRGGKLSPMKKH